MASYTKPTPEPTYEPPPVGQWIIGVNHPTADIPQSMPERKEIVTKNGFKRLIMLILTMVMIYGYLWAFWQAITFVVWIFTTR